MGGLIYLDCRCKESTWTSERFPFVVAGCCADAYTLATSTVDAAGDISMHKFNISVDLNEMVLSNLHSH
jgi:hypothetical protein